MNTIQSVWADFERNIIPKGADRIQRQEMRRAFYAGAQAVLGITVRISEADVSEDAGAAVLEGLHQETKMFAEQVRSGKA